MKVLLLASFLALAMGLPTSSEPEFYHEAVGIKAAANIKAAEEAIDFSGSRIIGGLPAGIGTHPYLAGLVITLTTGQTSVCGGALLSPSNVVTAAHCYFDGSSLAQTITVVLGSTFLFSGGVRIPSMAVVMHPAWTWSTVQNNIALITIPSVGFTPSIRNIQLPSAGLLSNDFAGVWAHASGYGATNQGGTIPQGQTKQHVWLEVISNEACQNAYSNSLTASTLCTDHSRNQSPCNGDSGGPLTGYINGQPVLIAISSFFHGSGCLGGPAGWTRISSYTFWLNSIV